MLGLKATKNTAAWGHIMVQKVTDFAIGEDLYGVSIAELELRVGMLEEEISRIKAELAKKEVELSAADKLFARKS